MTLALSLGDQVPVSTPADDQGASDQHIPCRHPLNGSFYRCGLFEVPLDWQHPEVGKGRIYYSRYPAAEHAVRKGTIFVDPGIPLASSTSLPPQDWLRMRGGALHNLTHGEYDIVVWDARGKGVHNLTIPGPLLCFKDGTERDEAYERWIRAWNTDFAPNLTPQDPLPRPEQVTQRWLFIQSKVVEHCLKTQNAALMRYVGTAATARDVVAMADAFDGPGSPVNFLGLSQGTLVGNYLLHLFPERAGRIVLDGPTRDLFSHAARDSYNVWKDDIANAGGTFNRFLRQCANDDCRLVHYSGLETEPVADYIQVTLALARTMLTTWRATPEADLANWHLKELFETIVHHTAHNSSAPFVVESITGISNTHATTWEESLGLGLMPVFCGDKYYESDSEIAAYRGREIASALVHDRGSIPTVTAGAYPPMQYFCHLWPIRAVERLSGMEAARPPAHPFLVVQYDMNPLSARRPFRDTAPGFREGEDGIEVIQCQFGVPLFSHSRCMARNIGNYLRNGTLPQQSSCYSATPSDEPPDSMLDVEQNAVSVRDAEKTNPIPASYRIEIQRAAGGLGLVVTIGLAAAAAFNTLAKRRAGGAR